MNSRISDKDKKDWENFLSSKESLPNKDSEQSQQNTKKIINFDLHGYSLEDANNLIHDFILKCYKEKISKIIVITGKGSRSQNINDPYKSKDLSILKHSVPNYIQSNIDLMKIIREIDFDQVKDNFSGSFDIILK